MIQPEIILFILMQFKERKKKSTALYRIFFRDVLISTSGGKMIKTLKIYNGNEWNEFE